MRRSIPTIIALAWLGACGGEPPAPPPVVEEPPTRADSAAMVLAAYDSTVFDTLQWATPQAALERGALVFRISCSACHGDGGRGNRAFVFQGDTLRPPSFLAADWALGKDPAGLRKKIFTGDVLGMPYWGLVGLTYKDVDAVAHYITDFVIPNYGDMR
ncbi:MAG: c-type cytochrome [Longimicrobiales bacterium]|nr:c-type cytochrome [Longimicrobiales bacterium]